MRLMSYRDVSEKMSTAAAEIARPAPESEENVGDGSGDDDHADEELAQAQLKLRFSPPCGDGGQGEEDGAGAAGRHGDERSAVGKPSATCRIRESISPMKKVEARQQGDAPAAVLLVRRCRT